MTASADNPRSPDARSNILCAVLLLLLVLAAFGPALRAGFIWDDDMFITENETLRTMDGLRVIWTEPAKNPHFYPLLMTLFWAMYQLWGPDPAGYHLVTVLFHAGTALLFWRLLLAVGARGAFLAALVFALHPVHVQSVAWATELKNTLSGFFYLGAILAWAREDRLGRARAYGLCAALFLASLLSKTTTVSLPLAILLIDVWKRGRVRRETIWLFVGLVAVALVPAAVTLGLERSRNVSFVAAQFLFPEKLIVVGLSIWFYLGKLLWPHPLIMVYPYWQIDMAQWREYVPLALLVASVPALFVARKRAGLGPLCAWVFFIATLSPIPFMDVNFVLQHSFVADHFVYLPSLGVIAVAAAGIDVLSARHRTVPPFLVTGVVAVVLGGLTWRQCAHYKDQEALWRHTLTHNPKCAVAYNNMGLLITKQGRLDEAITLIRRGIEEDPTIAKFHSNLALALLQQGDVDGAMDAYARAVELDPALHEARLELATLKLGKGDVASAVTEVQGALRVKPSVWEAQWDLGVLQLLLGATDDASVSLRKAAALRPHDAVFSGALERVLGRGNDGLRALQGAVRPGQEIIVRDAGAFRPRLLLARALLALGDEAASEALVDEVAQQDMGSAEVLYQLGALALDRRDFAEAADYFTRALALDPASFELMNNLAWIRATAPVDHLRDGPSSVVLAERAVAMTKRADPALLDTLAACYAEAGRFNDAVTAAEEAVKNAQRAGNDPLVRDIASRLELYRSGTPFRDKR